MNHPTSTTDSHPGTALPLAGDTSSGSGTGSAPTVARGRPLYMRLDVEREARRLGRAKDVTVQGVAYALCDRFPGFNFASGVMLGLQYVVAARRERERRRQARQRALEPSAVANVPDAAGDDVGDVGGNLADEAGGESWEAEQQRIRDEANAKRSRAAKGMPYAPKGGTRKTDEKVPVQDVQAPCADSPGRQAKAAAVNVGVGTVARTPDAAAAGKTE
jgi:hypothetical protein